MELKTWFSLCVLICTVFVNAAVAKGDTSCSEELVLASVLPLFQNISEEINQFRELKKSLLEMLTLMANSQKPKKHSGQQKKTDLDCHLEPDAAEFATSPHYANTRLISSKWDDSAIMKIDKVKESVNCARIQCSSACAKAKSCHAFNFYDDGASYICEFVPDNLCRSKTQLAFVKWPGGNVWEKKSSAKSPNCVDAKFGTDAAIPCSVLRPGCLGTWPKCISCATSCRQCALRQNYIISDGQCTFWPQGNVPYSVPLFARCSESFTYLASRVVDIDSGDMTKDYLLPLKVVHRLSKEYSNRKLVFSFRGKDDYRSTIFEYVDWVIDEDGTLSNLTFIKGPENSKGDLFNLNGAAMKPTPFVNVKDDRYGCGSLWLLNPNNATYCPGGKLSLFGQVRVDDDKVLSTGISIPPSVLETKMLSQINVYYPNFGN